MHCVFSNEGWLKYFAASFINGLAGVYTHTHTYTHTRISNEASAVYDGLTFPLYIAKWLLKVFISDERYTGK